MILVTEGLLTGATKLAPGILKSVGVLGTKMGAALKAGGSGAIVINKDNSNTRGQAAVSSGLVSAAGTALINSPALISGNIPGAILGAASGMAGAQGAALSAGLHGHRDTLIKSVGIPTAIVAASAPITNTLMKTIDPDTNIHVDVGTSAALTAGLGTGMWAMRHKSKNSMKRHIY